MALPISQLQAQVQNPILSALEGYQAGREMRKEDARFASEQLINRQAQEDRLANQAIVAQKQARQSEMHQGLRDLSENPNRTAKDLQDFSLRFPEMEENLRIANESASAEAREEDAIRAFNISTAINSGNADVAIEIAERYRDAARNSGDENKAALVDNLIDQMKTSPKAASLASEISAFFGMGAEKYAEMQGKLALQKQAQGAKDLTARQDDYGFYVSDQLKRGGDILSFNDWDLQKSDAASARVSQDLAERKFTASEKAAAKKEEVRKFEEIQEESGYKTFKELEDLYKASVAGTFKKAFGVWGGRKPITAEKVKSDYEYVTGNAAEVAVEQSPDVPTATSASGEKVQFVNGQWIPVE